MENKTIAYCGYDCKKCPVYLATQYKDIELLKQIVITPGESNVEQTIENLGCFGCCNSKSINHLCVKCSIRLCAVKKNVKNCGWCELFPCENLGYISEKTKEFLEEENKKMKQGTI